MTDITEDAPTLARPLHDALGPISDPDEGAETLVFSTTLQPSKFLGLSLKNGLLNIVTLTLWRFWGKTEVRRRVWSGVRLNDEAFEYTGRGSNCSSASCWPWSSWARPCCWWSSPDSSFTQPYLG